MENLVVLRVYKDGELKEVKQFTEAQIVIGMNQGVQLELDGASPLHAVIEKREQGYFVSDLGSSTGTFCKGEKVLDQAIQNGEELVIGDYTIEFFIGVPSSPVKTAQEDKPEEVKKEEPVVEEVKVEAKKPEPKKVETPPPAPSFEEVQAKVSEKVEEAPAPKEEVEVPSYVSAPGPVPKSKQTFAPNNIVNADEIIQPGKGTTVEVLMVWQGRVISSNNYSDKGSVTIGVDSSCDIIVPEVSGSKHKFLQVDAGASVFLADGMKATYIQADGSKKMSSDQVVRIEQGDMLRVDLGEISLYVRYKTQAPKALAAPFLDFTASELTGVVIAFAMAFIVGIYAWIYSPQDITDEILIEEQIRRATVTFKPPPRIKRPKVQKITETKAKKKVVKVKDKKQKKRKTRGGKATTTKVDPGKAKGLKKRKKQSKRGNTSDPGKGTTKKAVKAANIKSAKVDPNSVGLLGTLGSKGSQARLNKTFDGAKGGLIGASNRATGQAGINGAGSGDNFGTKGVGGTGSGTATKGIGGVGTGTGFGGKGKGLGGFGEKGSVNIQVGGGGDEEIGGYIDKEAIRRVIRRNKRAIKYCYDSELNRNNQLYGKVSIFWQIHEGGAVKGAKVVSNTLKDNGKVAKCILNRLRTWRFPEPPANTVGEITFPFVFSAQ